MYHKTDKKHVKYFTAKISIMKKLTFPISASLLFFALLICFGVQAQTFSGDLTLSSQSEVDIFNYSEVSGNLTIEGADIVDITSLSILTFIGEDLIIQNNDLLANLNGMQNLVSIGGDLEIFSNTLLVSIDDFQNVTSIAGNIEIGNNIMLTTLNGLQNIFVAAKALKITRNTVLENLDGLQNITSVGGSLEIYNNDAITNLDGLSNIITINGYLKISSNDELTNLSGLQKITSVDGSLYIYNNDVLTNLEGLHNIESIESFLKIEGNDAITDLEGLRNVTSVGSYLEIFNNNMLANIDGLQNLIFVDGDVDVNNNEELIGFCGLFPLLNDGVYSGIYSVYDNAANPTAQEIIDGGACSEQIANSGIILSIGTPNLLLEEDLSLSCGISNVPITVKDFTNVANVSLKLNYNKEALAYTGVTINSELVNPVYKEDAAVFSMTYSGAGVTLADDDVLFTLHFTVDPNINGTPFNLVWSAVPGDCEFAGPGGEPVYNGTFEDLSTVVITDELPEIICTDDIEVENDAGVCGAVVNYIAPVGIDNCSDPTTIQTAGFASGEIFPVGQTINTFQVTDSKGNTAECSFVVSVIDTEAPVISDCPANIIITTGEDRITCDQIVTWTPPSATDNCEVISLTSDFEPDDIFLVGTTTVTYTASDNATPANVKTCSFTVTVIDDTAPVITCLDNQIRGTDDPACEYSVLGTEFDPISTSDNCGITEQTYELTGATEVAQIEATTLASVVFSKGVTTVKWIVRDAAGNTSECLFNVTIVDDDTPTIVCAENQTRGTDAPTCDYSTIGNEFDPVALSDNCEVTEQSYELTGETIAGPVDATTLDGVIFSKGITTVNWVVKDDAGNVSECSFDVLVVDDDVPIITSCAPAQSAIVTDGCSVEMPNFISTAEATDNCEVVTITQFPEIGDWLSFDDTPHLVTITATDDAGNTSTCTTTFTVLKATLSGKMIYNNAVQSPMNNVTLTLSPAGDEATCLTDDDGNYLFTGLCAGTYTITVSDNAKPVGYINATDAGAVNKWGAAGGEIEYVNFLAGDVAENNFYFNSTDALRIQKHFVEGLGFDKDPWSYWAKGFTIGSNAENKHANFDVAVGGTNLVDYNIYALCTGDFNGSFSPDPLKSAVSFLSLFSENDQQISKNSEMELSLSAGSDMEVGAISMVLNDPSEFVEVLDIKINGSKVPVVWAIKDNELRIGWNSVIPVYFASNEHLVTLKLKTTDAFESGQSFNLELIINPLNELADGNYEVIQGATLKAATLCHGVTGINEEMEVDRISLSNYPNPFNNSTTLQYILPFDGKVSINVYNSLGQLVNKLIDSDQESGQYSISDYGDDLQPGVYVAKLRLSGQNNDLTAMIKLQVLK